MSSLYDTAWVELRRIGTVVQAASTSPSRRMRAHEKTHRAYMLCMGVTLYQLPLCYSRPGGTGTLASGPTTALFYTALPGRSPPLLRVALATPIANHTTTTTRGSYFAPNPLLGPSSTVPAPMLLPINNRGSSPLRSGRR